MAVLQLALFGPFQMHLAGNLVAQFPTAKVQALLAYLSVEAQTPHARDTLIGLFWPDYTTDSARQNLRQTLFRLRQIIPSAYLLVTNQTVQFDGASDYSLDVTTFIDLITVCHRHAHSDLSTCAACMERLQQAVALYRGDFLAGFFLDDSPAFEEWLLLKREWLRREALQALSDLAVYHERHRDYAHAQVYAWRQVELDPPREQAHQQLMRVLARSGRRSEALAQYESCRRLLAEELGVEPSAETVALYEQIRTETLSDKGQGARGRGQGARDNARPVILSPSHLVTLSSPSLPLEWKDTANEPTSFVARAPELALLQEYLDKALAGNGQIVFVTGEAGSGKTALLREFAWRAQAATDALLVASGHCQAQSGLGDPYLPFRHLLRLLTGDLEMTHVQTLLNRLHASRLWGQAAVVSQMLVESSPDLVNTFVPGPALFSRVSVQVEQPAEWLHRLEQLVQRRKTTGNDAGQSDLFEQFSGLLLAVARRQPLLLLVDDLQWADDASLSLLFHLGRGLVASRILLVGTYRSEDVALGRGSERHPLEPVLNELKRQHGEIVIDLDQAQGRTFVDAWLDTQPNHLGPDFRTTLYQRTQGKPLFTLELLRTMRERGDLIRDEAGQWMESPALNWRRLPARVEAVIEERIARLPEELRQTLAIASVEGEVFTAQVVARVQGLQERPLLQQLTRELERRHRLVRRQAEVQVDHKLLTRCQFTHALFQDYLYHQLSVGERRLLHGEVATALAELYHGRIDEIMVQLANHYAEAGETAKAIEYLLQAGDRARTFYAHQEAIAAYQRALAFLKEQGDYERAARTLTKLGLTYHLTFDFDLAQRAFDEGFALWQRADEIKSTIALLPAPHALRLSGGEPETLDPTYAQGHAVYQLFSGLVEWGPALDIVPAVARTWEMLEEGCKYIFHLREDVHWSDGLPVTAADFVYAWWRTLHATASSQNGKLPYDILLLAIKGAQAFHQGQLTDPDEVGVRACDDLTLEVELAEPTPYFLHMLAQSSSAPVPRHLVAVHGATWAEAQHIVTNGPFRLERWQPGCMIVFARNPTYYGRFDGNVERVEQHFVPDWATRLALYEADELDVIGMGDQPPAEIDRVRQRYASDYVTLPWLLTGSVGFDVSRPPFDDERVRQALALATNRETLANVVLRGHVTPTTGGVIPPGLPGHATGIGLPYDPDRARQLLVEAGYPGGRNFPSVDALLRAGMAGELAVGYLATHWRDLLGIEIGWNANTTAYWEFIYRGQAPPLFFQRNMADYPDPDTYLRYYEYLFAGQFEPYAQLVAQARRTSDWGKRLQLCQQADRLLVEKAFIIPLWCERLHLLVKPWVRKFSISALGPSFWKDVVIEEH